MNKDRDWMRAFASLVCRDPACVRIAFALKVCPGCDWDYKVKDNHKYGDDKMFWVAVRDDPAPEVFRSDLFGNIYYGYVGRAIGITQQELWIGAESIAGGKNSESDRDAIRVGFNLWDSAGNTVTGSDLRRKILRNLWRFQNNLEDTGVRKPLAPIRKSGG
jgi:hypothetical protein